MHIHAHTHTPDAVLIMHKNVSHLFLFLMSRKTEPSDNGTKDAQRVNRGKEGTEACGVERACVQQRKSGMGTRTKYKKRMCNDTRVTCVC